MNSKLVMPLCIQRKNIPLGQDGPKGYFQIFRPETSVKTSLGTQPIKDMMFMFTLSGHSFLFSKETLQQYISQDDYFPKNNENSLECCFCNQENHYGLITFYKLRNPDVENELDGNSLEEILHATDRKPLCFECIESIFETTIQQITGEPEEYVSLVV